MSGAKVCPKCANKPQMELLDLAITPFTINATPRPINVGIPERGVPLRAFECPQCGLIEIYKAIPQKRSKAS
jgi:predicted nucleic-acid-binding Zn-ribbon protein